MCGILFYCLVLFAVLEVLAKSERFLFISAHLSSNFLAKILMKHHLTLNIVSQIP